MRILINASNLKKGGGLQGCDSIGFLITEEVDFDYDQVYSDMRKRGSIVSIIKYPVDRKIETVVKVNGNSHGKSIGAGNYTGVTMMPALKAINADHNT